MVIVVSEETGSLSLAYKGRLRRGLDEPRLRRILSSVLYRGAAQPKDSALRRRLDTIRQYVSRNRTAAETAADLKEHGL